MATITSEEVKGRVNNHLVNLGLPTGFSAVAEIGKHDRCGKDIIVLRVSKGNETRRFLALHSPYEEYEVADLLSTLTVENLLLSFEAPALPQAIIQMLGFLMMIENSLPYPVKGNPIWN